MKRSILVSVLFLTLLFICQGEIGTPPDSDRPVFNSPYDGGVLLRYRYPEGRADNYLIRINTQISMNFAGRNMEIPMVMKMHTGFTGKGKDADGNYSVDMLISRMTIEMPKQGIRYDSGDAGSKGFPGSEVLSGLINNKIGMVVTARGKIVRADTEKILSAIMKGNLKMYKMMKESIDNITRNTLNQFPEGPVKAGDKFVGMHYTQNMQGMLKMKVKTSYEVLSVSGDRRKVLLKPVMDIKFESLNPSMKLETKVFKVSGWLLFDRDAGRVDRSRLVMDYGFAMEMSGQKVDMTMRSLIEMRLR